MDRDSRDEPTGREVKIKLLALLVVAFGQVSGSGFEVAEEATGAFVWACDEVKL
jgi:hypothetical protein